MHKTDKILEQLKVEKDIPIPETRDKFQMFLMSMEIGDSVEFEETLRSSITSAASKIRKRKLGCFTVRKWTDTTFRIWRIEPKDE